MRHGVGKSKRDEINCALLLPMRKPIGSETNVRVRIEEAQFSHGASTVQEREAALKAPKTQPLSGQCAVSNPLA